ncbi:MAG: SPOR domain-containing protein [Bacteroidia bacterium]
MPRSPLFRLIALFSLIPAFLFSHPAGVSHAFVPKPICLYQLRSDSDTNTVKKKDSPSPFIIKPTVGMGVGMMSFFGDQNGSHVSNPQYGRLGYDLSLSQKLTPYLSFNLYALFGKLAANEQGLKSNLNFESEIRLGGFFFEYNFDQFFKNKGRKISPYVSLGFESFEFLSKTDLYDKYGNKYFYWNDGTVRNIAQTAANAGSAVVIQRDYNYESDIRSQNINNRGKYNEYAFAIPMGAGVLFHLSPRCDFKIGTTMHLALTDNIDGVYQPVSDKSTHYDKFFMTSFQIRYSLTNPADTINTHIYDDVDMEGIVILADEDHDGVPDLKDSCPGTPAGVPVDAKGCPLDDDHDGVPNYKDNQLDTPPGSVVDEHGVAISDSTIAQNWDRFMDSTMKYADHVTLPPGGYAGFHPKPKTKEYTVLLGTYKKGLSTEKMSSYLSIEDIRSTNLGDSTTAYHAGKFDDVLNAEKRKKELQAQGMPDAKVVYLKDGKFVEPDVFDTNHGGKDQGSGDHGTKDHGTKDHGTKDQGSGDQGSKDHGTKDHGTKDHGTKDHDSKGQGSVTDGNSEISNTPGVVFRVQLGAFKHRINPATFSDAGNVLELKTEDGLYKYTTGSFHTFDEAAKHKIEMLSKGFSGAFIVAFKNGKRVALTDVGAIPAGKANPNDSDNVKAPSVKKELVKFKVQVGVFKNEPPAEIKNKLKGILGGLQQTSTSSGLTRYTAGSFQTLEEAEKFKEELKKKGIDGCFVVAFFKDDLISIQEAQELLKQ